MTSPLPPVEFDAPPVNPAGYGLYSAATIINTGTTRRHLGGVNISAINCDDGYGTYDPALCDPGEPEEKTALRSEDSDTFLPTVVWAADECGTGNTESEIQSRALQTLALREPILVEAAFATRLLADAGAPTEVPDLVTAISTLEEFLGETGHYGVIHAARRWAAPASQYRWNNQTGPVRRTPLENAWAFGGGYASILGDTLVATGPVYVWRDDPFSQAVTDAQTNLVYAMGERVVVAGYECAIMAVTIVPPVEPEV